MDHEDRDQDEGIDVRSALLTAAAALTANVQLGEALSVLEARLANVGSGRSSLFFVGYALGRVLKDDSSQSARVPPVKGGKRGRIRRQAPQASD